MDEGRPAAGWEVGGYRLLAPLGSGGMGTVYRAVDGGGAVVALKLLHPHVGADPAARERLRREVAALQRLHHPGVAAVLDAEADSTEAFVVTELVDGLTLDEHVRRGGPLPAVELAELADGLRDALEAVHAAGVVHRDLKPSNVMLTARGPVLIDFGIAQAADDPRVTSVGLVIGTPGYLAPELLADGDPGPATDWWGWAAVLAYAATGRAPFGARPLDAVLERTRAGDVDVAGVDPAVAAPLAAALRPDPAHRAAPQDVVARLDEAAAATPQVPATQAVTRAAAVPWGPIGGAHAAEEPAPTRMLAHDGRTRAVPVVPPAVVPGHGPGTGADPAVAWSDGSDRGWASGGGPDGGRSGHGGGPDDGWADDGWADDGWSHDQAAAGDPDAAPAWTAPRPRRRAGSVLALAVLAVVAATLYPGVTVLAVLAGLLVARTVGSAAAALDRRRERRGGPRRGDAARAVGTTPWHLVRALVALLPSVLVAASVVVVVGGLLWWALETGLLVVPAAGTAPDGGNAPLAFAGALGVAVLGGLLTAWFGPLSRGTRDGARRVLGAVAPGWSGATVLVVAALAAAGVLGVLLMTDHPVTWWPLAGPPVLA